MPAIPTFASVFALVLILLAGCTAGSPTPTATPSPTPTPTSGCGFPPPSNIRTMTHEEFESWLRFQLPLTPARCVLTDEQIQRIMADFADDQARQRRWDQHFVLVDQMANQRAIYREISFDNFISPGELLYLCDEVTNWRGELDGIMDFMSEYRRAEPEFVQNDPSLNTLESETRRLLIWVASLETRCNPN